MLIAWSPCHLLPYDLGLMLPALAEQQRSCLQSKASSLPRGGVQASNQTFLQRVDSGVFLQPRCEQTTSVRGAM